MLDPCQSPVGLLRLLVLLTVPIKVCSGVNDFAAVLNTAHAGLVGPLVALLDHIFERKCASFHVAQQSCRAVQLFTSQCQRQELAAIGGTSLKL